MGALFDAVSSAVEPQRMPTNADFGTDGRWHGEPLPGNRKFATEQDMRASMQDEPASSSGGLYDTIASAVGAPAGAQEAAPSEPRAPREPASLQLVKTVADQASGVGAAIMGGWRGIAAIASGAGLDEAARQVHAPELAGGLTARGSDSGTPMSKAAAAPGEAMGYLGNRAGEITTDVTGSPAAGAAVNTALQGAPTLLLLKKAPVAQAEKLVGSSSIADVKPAAIATPTPNLDIPTVIRQRQAVAANQVPAARTASPAVEAATPAAAAAQAEAHAPKFTESAPEAEPGKALPPAEQARRAQVLRSVGIDEARRSAISGDPMQGAVEFQTTKFNEPAGQAAKDQFAAERTALEDHAQKIVQDTGGTAGMDGQALEARGHTILAPLEGFKQWFTDQTKALYDDARAKAQGQPVALGKFNEILGTDSKFANTDTIELRKGIAARMKELGMIDKEGNVLPATVDQAENLRQYVNEEWSPKSNGRIRELKNALDEDVTSAAGEDTFAKARALHSMKMRIFDDPNGLSSILDSEGPNGINRKVPVEKVAEKIAALPNAQFAHIVKTLKSVPPELQPQAQAALAEIKAQFANKLSDVGAAHAGQWNARGVTKYLNSTSAKLPQIFSPEELANIGNLNEAGHILRVDPSYPGAAAQTANAMKRGLMANTVRPALAATGGTVGSFFGVPGLGSAAGDMLGAKVSGSMSEKAALTKWNKGMTKLSEFPK